VIISGKAENTGLIVFDWCNWVSSTRSYLHLDEQHMTFLIICGRSSKTTSSLAKGYDSGPLFSTPLADLTNEILKRESSKCILDPPRV